jgi:hypothetical protein
MRKQIVLFTGLLVARGRLRTSTRGHLCKFPTSAPKPDAEFGSHPTERWPR